MIYNDVTELIGDTPLVRIDPSVHGLKNFEIYSKLEYFNPFGSLKDRISWNILKQNIQDAQNNNKTIIESSSGNTGKALSILSKMHGLNFKTVTNRIKVPEVRMMLQFLGAEIEELPGLSDCPDPNDPNDPVAIVGKMQEKEPGKYFYTDQYYNKLNYEAHYKAGLEIADDLDQVDYLFGTLGTCGSTFGATKALIDKGRNTKAIGVVSSAASWVPGGRNINELWETGFYDKTFYEDVIETDIKNAIKGMQILNQKCGILAGPTTGLNFITMINYLKEKDQSTNEKKVAVFIACDRSESYMNYIKLHTPELFNIKTTAKQSISDIQDSQIPEDIKINAEILNSFKDPLIFDIRGNFAYSIGHIKGSMNILDELLVQIIEQGQTLPKDKTVVITCSIGKISPKYATFLRNQGYTAYSLEGGINKWKKDGNELQKTI